MKRVGIVAALVAPWATAACGGDDVAAVPDATSDVTVDAKLDAPVDTKVDVGSDATSGEAGADATADGGSDASGDAGADGTVKDGAPVDAAPDVGCPLDGGKCTQLQNVCTSKCDCCNPKSICAQVGGLVVNWCCMPKGETCTTDNDCCGQALCNPTDGGGPKTCQ